MEKPSALLASFQAVSLVPNPMPIKTPNPGNSHAVIICVHLWHPVDKSYLVTEYRSLKIESCHDADIVVTRGTGGSWLWQFPVSPVTTDLASWKHSGFSDVTTFSLVTLSYQSWVVQLLYRTDISPAVKYHKSRV